MWPVYGRPVRHRRLELGFSAGLRLGVLVRGVFVGGVFVGGVSASDDSADTSDDFVIGTQGLGDIESIVRFGFATRVVQEQCVVGV